MKQTLRSPRWGASDMVTTARQMGDDSEVRDFTSQQTIPSGKGLAFETSLRQLQDASVSRKSLPGQRSSRGRPGKGVEKRQGGQAAKGFAVSPEGNEDLREVLEQGRDILWSQLQEEGPLCYGYSGGSAGVPRQKVCLHAGLMA